jgi:hypothetical protein
VARKKQPLAGAHALGVCDVGAAYSRRGDALYFSHCHLLCCSTVRCRDAGAWKEARKQSRVCHTIAARDRTLQSMRQEKRRPLIRFVH